MNLSYGETQEGSYEPSNDVREGRYEGYREPDLPEGYTAYGQNGYAEDVYDSYDYEQDSNYEYAESPDGTPRPKRSVCKKIKSCCCDMGKTKLE